MLISALRSGDSTQIIVAVFASLFLVFCVIPIHEFAHAFVADKLGDDTPRNAGQLTLDPMTHVDIVGGIMIALVGIGWGKPTPINPSNFKNPRKGAAIVAAAGPLTNLILGFVFVLMAVIVSNTSLASSLWGLCIYYFFVYAAQITVCIGVLNLLPIPMFDGYSILAAFLSPKATYWVITHQRMLMIIIIILLFTNILTYPVSWLSNLVLNFFYTVASLPF